MLNETWNKLFGNETELQIESFSELKEKVTTLISEEVALCASYPELGQHATILGSKVGDIAHITDEDMNKLFEVIKSIHPLPDTSPFARNKEFEDLINSIK